MHGARAIPGSVHVAYMVGEVFDLLCKGVLGCLIPLHVNILIAVHIQCWKAIDMPPQKRLLVQI